MPRLTVVVSQAPGKHPAKRSLEESIVAALLMEPDVELSVVPNLYDLGPDHTGRLFLGGVKGDMVVLSWLFPRAAFWLLDRDGIKGQFGETLLKPPADEEEVAEETPTEKPETIGPAGAIPDRYIYTIDLRDSNKPAAFIDEVKRIAAECKERHAEKARQKAASNPQVVQLGLSLAKPEVPPQNAALMAAFTPEALLAPAGRR